MSTNYEIDTHTFGEKVELTFRKSLDEDLMVVLFGKYTNAASGEAIPDLVPIIIAAIENELGYPFYNGWKTSTNMDQVTNG